MQNKPSFLAVSAALLLSAVAGGAYAADPSYKYAHNYYSYTVNADGSYTMDVDTALTILKEEGVEGGKQHDISYSTSVEKVEVLAAFTEKAKGQRIDVPKSNYQLEVNSGKDNASPAFSDSTSLTIIFPDVAVGDTVHWQYRLTRTEPLFPNHISDMETFSKSVIFDDVRIKYDLPEAMPVKYEIAELTEKKPEIRDGRKVLEWTFQNKQRAKDTDDWGNVYRFGEEPGYMISSFGSYQEIAAAYGVRAKERAAVTERIQKLADEITRDKTTPYEQAKALYQWVSENINYAGNCIGVGAVVPRPLDFVLDNRMGDCKDHATLLEALLAAKKIASTQALINVGSVYDLPKISVVSMVNHVMNYIPSLDIYADATSEGTPFGTLADGTEGKPILLVDGYREGLRTPSYQHEKNKASVYSEITIGTDGSAKGRVEWEYQGKDALFANTEKAISEYQKYKADSERVEDYSKSMVKRFGFEGGKVDYGREEKPQAPDLSKSHINFDVQGFINAGSLGAFNVYPPFSSSLISSSIHGSKTADLPLTPFTCKGRHFEENYVYKFPKNLKILAVPDSIKASNELVSFQASYQLKKNVLTVTRKLDDLTPGPVCQPEVFKQYKEIAQKVMPNLKSQVVYKYF